MLLDLNSIVGLSFSQQQHAKLAAHFPHSRAADGLSESEFTLHSNNCRRRRSDIFGQTAGERERERESSVG